ncbi:MAG: hypothetical protein EPO26_16130 [Chloroflexota bacterium]|nr:MAG: hypothetical protein EPO26_16130 [Chloroflexota bacterium]
MVVIALGAAVAIAMTYAGPLFAIGGLVAAVVGFVLIGSQRLTFLAFLLTVTVLPFGVIPIGVGGVRPTFIDATLVLLLASTMGGVLSRRVAWRPPTPIDIPIAAFIIVSLAAFTLGTAYAFNSEAARQYAKLINSVVFFFVVTQIARESAFREWIVAVLVFGGAAAGAIGAGLYHLPTETASSILRALRPLGYPSGDVLRYIEDAGVRTDTMRAIGTSIDPNVYGALLLVCGVLALGQAYESRGQRRAVAVLALAPILYALLLTLSRGSWLGFASGALLLTMLRRPRLLWLIPIVGSFGVVLFSTQLARFAEHFMKAVFARDQATGMRLGEYKDAFNLIQQNPLLGVGFGGAPSVDLYIGVSSTYLLVAEEMGLIGLGLLALILWRTLSGAWLAYRSSSNAVASVATVGSALCGMLVAAAVDRHFFDLRFQNISALFWMIVALVVVSSTRDHADDRLGGLGGGT